MKIYSVEYTDYEQSYVVAHYTTKEEALRHIEIEGGDLVILQDRLFDSYDEYIKSIHAIKLQDLIELRDELDKNYPKTMSVREWVKGGIPITREYKEEADNARSLLSQLIHKVMGK